MFRCNSLCRCSRMSGNSIRQRASSRKDNNNSKKKWSSLNSINPCKTLHLNRNTQLTSPNLNKMVSSSNLIKVNSSKLRSSKWASNSLSSSSSSSSGKTSLYLNTNNLHRANNSIILTSNRSSLNSNNNNSCSLSSKPMLVVTATYLNHKVKTTRRW
jgi:hypothetical protein